MWRCVFDQQHLCPLSSLMRLFGWPGVTGQENTQLWCTEQQQQLVRGLFWFALLGCSGAVSFSNQAAWPLKIWRQPWIKIVLHWNHSYNEFYSETDAQSRSRISKTGGNITGVEEKENIARVKMIILKDPSAKSAFYFHFYCLQKTILSGHANMSSLYWIFFKCFRLRKSKMIHKWRSSQTLQLIILVPDHNKTD